MAGSLTRMNNVTQVGDEYQVHSISKKSIVNGADHV